MFSWADSGDLVACGIHLNEALQCYVKGVALLAYAEAAHSVSHRWDSPFHEAGFWRCLSSWEIYSFHAKPCFILQAHNYRHSLLLRLIEKALPVMMVCSFRAAAANIVRKYLCVEVQLLLLRRLVALGRYLQHWEAAACSSRYVNGVSNDL